MGIDPLPPAMRTPRAMLRAVAFVSSLLAPGMLGAQAEPRYLNQLRAELQAMGIAAQCAPASSQAGVCRAVASSAPAGAPGGRRYTLVLEYSDQTDTVYIFLERYATLPADAPTAPAAFRRFAEINWEMLTGKLEWSARTGEVRLGAVMHTDSNFDRRAFRGVVRSVLRLGDRYATEIAQITGRPVGESVAVPTSPAAPAPGGSTPAPAGMTPLPTR